MRRETEAKTERIRKKQIDKFVGEAVLENSKLLNILDVRFDTEHSKLNRRQRKK